MSEIYWITVLGNLSNLLVTMCVCFGLATVALALAIVLEIDEEDRKPFYKWIKRCGVAFIVTSLMAVFTPSTKDLYAIYGIMAIRNRGGYANYTTITRQADGLQESICTTMQCGKNNRGLWAMPFLMALPTMPQSSRAKKPSGKLRRKYSTGGLAARLIPSGTQRLFYNKK